MKTKSHAGFTLIELLIVVGILALLAAMSIPHFLEAQVRSKVSRARTDMRTLAVALEAYAVEYRSYPPILRYGDAFITPESFTTPVAFLTSLPHDPFAPPMPSEPLQRYHYHNVKQLVEDNTPNWPPNDLLRYGDWRFVSLGPKREFMAWISYDPTNGTISDGNVIRTQRSAEGRILFTCWDPNNPQR